MSRRGQWTRVGFATALAGLLAGRWLAVSSVDRWWVEALGVAAPHAAMDSLARTLAGIAFLAALVWCSGNLLLVYRAIGSVHVPRRVGNIEIVEAVPRRYLLVGAWISGLLLAIAMSRGAADWWLVSAPAAAARPLGLTDPILSHDYSYYLFVLPWWRTLLGFATRLTGVMLGVVIVLYTAVGGVRWVERRLAVSDIARSHLAGLLAFFALALFFGYRLEPAEYVAGVEEVPIDALLQGVRIPVSRLLSGMALVAFVASAIWIWVPRSIIPLGAWGVLAGGSFFGHYVAPAFAASVGDPERRAIKFVDARAAAERLAFGLDARDTMIHSIPPTEPDLLSRLPAIERVPLWDGPVLTAVLERVAKRAPAERFYGASLALYPDGAGRAVPLFLAAREIDFNSAREFDREITWEEAHVGPYAFAHGAVAVGAHRVNEAGLPLYVRDYRRPDSLSPVMTDIALADSAVFFAPAATEFAVAPPDQPIAGVRAGGLGRRLALAWTLQSPQLLGSSAVQSGSLVIWRRAVADRLAHYAPFARFGAAYPVIADQRLYWLSSGYVAAPTFPLARRTQWRGQFVRYLRAGFIGVVDAATGGTAVYQRADADPLSSLWATLTKGLVQPAESLPAGLRGHVLYPAELFQVQAALLHETQMGVPQSVRPILARARARGLGAVVNEPYWWVDPVTGHGTPVLSLRSVMVRGDPPAYAAVLDGWTENGVDALRLTHFGQPIPVPAFSRSPPRPTIANAPVTIQDSSRIMLFDDGVLTLRTTYTSPSPPDVPRLSDVAVGWGSAVGTGSTLAIALARAQAAARFPALGASEWADARRRFEEMDDARRAGDWTAFGQAYEELRRILGVTRDST